MIQTRVSRRPWIHSFFRRSYKIYPFRSLITTSRPSSDSKIVLFLSPVDSFEGRLSLFFHLVKARELFKEARLIEGATKHAEAIALISFEDLLDTYQY